MNMQALMKQAQNLQKDMLKTKEEIDSMEFTETNGFVTVKVSGSKKVISINIDQDSMDINDSDDIEALQDMIMLALNVAFKKVDDVTEQKMGKYSNIPGLF